MTRPSCRVLIARQLLIGLTVLLFFLTDGCERSATPPVIATASTHPTPPAQPAIPVSGAEFKQLVARSGSITFRSWNGKWIGTDCDTDLEFKPGGAVTLTEYRDAVDEYRGTYDVDAKGVVPRSFQSTKVHGQSCWRSATQPHCFYSQPAVNKAFP